MGAVRVIRWPLVIAALLGSLAVAVAAGDRIWIGKPDLLKPVGRGSSPSCS
jgi:hypothetical protein